MKRLAIVAVSLVLLTAGSETNWNIYGGATVGTDTNWNFFELNGMKKLPDGHIQVWTKSLSQTDMVNTKPDDAVKDQALNRARNGYRPIVGRTGKYSKQQLVYMIFYEAIANEGSVPPRAQTLFEIDCKADMMRILSFRVGEGDKMSSSDSPTGWQHIAPETNGSGLAGAVCH